MYTIRYNNNYNFKLNHNFRNSLYDVLYNFNIGLIIYMFLIITIINNMFIT